jgi:hypothetical protein
MLRQAGDARRRRPAWTRAHRRGRRSRPLHDGRGHADTDEGTCEDYWLVERGNAKEAPPRWIGNACDGQRTQILTSVDRQTRTFTFGTHSRFSNDTTHGVVTVGLDPARLAATEAWTLSSRHGDHVSWSWDGFTGTLELGVDYRSGKQPRAWTLGDRDAPLIDVRAVAIHG